MPSNLPSSFASAAAGQNTSRGTNGGRNDGRGNNSGEWPRQRSTNGTLTFRRPSTTPSNQIQTNQMSSTDSVQLPPSVAESVSQRYSREDLLSIFEHSSPQPDVSSLFSSGWNPGHVNGNHGNAPRGWGKSNESNVLPQEPDICWDASGGARPSHLRDLTTEEKELFSSDVNSPVKQPTQQQTKEGAGPGGGLNGRKASVSHGASNNFSLASPSSATRPSTRRRETTDSNPFSGGGGLVSPTSAVRPRDETSFWLGGGSRKTNDTSTFEEPDEDLTPREATAPRNTNPTLPFGGLIRSNTATASTGFASASSLWGQQAVSSPTTSGLGGFGNFTLPGASAVGERRPANPRGESRLAHLIPKDSSDNIAARANEPASAIEPGANRTWRPRPRTDTDPFGSDDALSGSAVLGGAQDTSPPSSLHQAHRPQAFDTPVKGNAGDFGMSGINLGSEQDHAPMSPSDTNPFRSPPGERGDNDEALERSHAHAVPDHVGGFGGAAFSRAFAPQAAFDGSDRSQTSSAGARALPPMNNLTGWPSSATPDRERVPFGGAFGNSVFAPMGEPYSPGLGHPASNIFGPPATGGLAASGSISRGSRLGSLLPAAMHTQMQGHDNDSITDSLPDLRQVNPIGLGAIGRNPYGDHARETDSPMRAGRGPFSDMFSSSTPSTSEPPQSSMSNAPQPQGFPQGSGTPFGATQNPEPASAQNRIMVMPDRMRWVYLDPQGQQQGPFTGLEMNDWYKANFFTADLSVKRVEDAEFEPLGQLIRRIGNSREPFLVPQIGIPHGPPAQGGPFSPNPGGVNQPPLVGAFPSFGRTLTAQEQNDLERRKQEEQFIQAQQREFGQHRLPRSQIPGHPLHHHSSAQSLQSQPSYGSIPGAMAQSQAPIGPIGGAAPFFGGPQAQQPIGQGNNRPSNITELFRDEELSRTSNDDRQHPAGFQGVGAPIGGHLQQPIGAPSSDLRGRLPSTDDLAEDSEGFRGRLQEFEQLRAQHDAEMERRAAAQKNSAEQTPANSGVHGHPLGEHSPARGSNHRQNGHEGQDTQSSLDKQFQHAQSQAIAAAKGSGYPSSFPPPPKSSTPLPAPAPQRVKSNLPEQYASSSRSETPDVASSVGNAQTPALAPWAKESAESHRVPSLREIQDAEAKHAAKVEEIAAAERRALAEQEAAREREKASVVAPGLPNSSTWAASPVSAGPSSSPWAKPTTTKGPAPGFTAPTRGVDRKQTLADIQREEEEKRKALAASNASKIGVPVPGGGIRYADKASKITALGGASPLTAAPAAGWNTVGAGGKVKVPTGPAAQVRTVSSGTAKPAAPVAAPAVIKPVIKTNVGSVAPGKTDAMASFHQWLHGQLTRGGVIAGTDINVLAQTLVAFPLEPGIIADAIYGSSTTINGHDFATEFIRRKRQADKGVVEKQDTVLTPAAGSAGGGWNEVAKKSSVHKEGTPEEGNRQAAEFKVVPGRKKGKK